MIVRILLEYTNKTNYKRISIMISLDHILNLHHMKVQNNYFLPIFDNLIDKYVHFVIYIILY